MRTRFAIFGSGQMARVYASILLNHPRACLVGFVGNARGKCDALQADYGVPALSGGDYVSLLASADVDAVIVATPEWVREVPIAAAMEAGTHLLVEKPFADTWETAKRLSSQIDAYPRTVNVCHVLRYSPRFCAARQMVREGLIGEVRSLHARRNSNNLRVRRVLGKTNLAYWLSPHDIDLMRLIVGADVESVYTQSRGSMDTSDDYLLSTLRFQNRVTATAEVSWCTPPLSMAAREVHLEIRGTAGVVSVNDFDNNVYYYGPEERVSSRDTYEEFVVAGQHHGFFRMMLDDFIDQVQSGVRILSVAQDTLEVLRTCEMISRSSRLGRPVYRSEVE